MINEKAARQTFSLKDNLKKHKKKIITATVIVGASAIVVIGIKFLNSKVAKELLTENITKALGNNKLSVENLVTDKTIDISVPSYVRNASFGAESFS